MEQQQNLLGLAFFARKIMFWLMLDWMPIMYQAIYMHHCYRLPWEVVIFICSILEMWKLIEIWCAQPQVKQQRDAELEFQPGVSTLEARS